MPLDFRVAPEPMARRRLFLWWLVTSTRVQSLDISPEIGRFVCSIKENWPFLLSISDSCFGAVFAGIAMFVG